MVAAPLCSTTMVAALLCSTTMVAALLLSTTMVAVPLMVMNAKECAMVVTSCVAKIALAQKTTKKVAKNGLMRMVATSALSATKRESRLGALLLHSTTMVAAPLMT